MMKQDNDRYRLEELEAAYWAATITDAQQQELRALLNTQEALRAEQQALKIMLQGFGSLAKEYEEPRVIDLKRSDRPLKVLSGFVAVAAMVAIALVVIFENQTASAPPSEIYCYINGEPITDIDVAMEQTKYLANLEKLSKTLSAFESITQNR